MDTEMAQSCLFCRIVTGEITARVAGSNDDALAFYDINPAAPSHLLVVPRRHIDDAEALSEDDGELLAALFSLARQIARQEGIHNDGYRLVINVGPDSGSEVAHLHLHVLGGRRLHWPPG